MFETLNEAYKIVQMQKKKLSALEAFYQATLGGARSLYLDNVIGNFDEGKEADFIVIDLEATPLQKLRMSTTSTIEEKLFALMILGDDRNIDQTFVLGKSQYRKK